MTMTTNTPKDPSPAARRMRTYRKRQRQGVHYIRIPLHVSEIDTLIHMKLLKEEERRDDEALRAAVLSLVYRALDAAA